MCKNFILNIIIIAALSIAAGINIYSRKTHAGAGKEHRSYFFNTKDIAPEIKGFGGPIEMQVELNKDNSIKDLKVLRHNETSEYADGITKPEFLGQFKGKGVKDRFVVGEDIDAVTHATMSSRAVAATLKASLERLSGGEKIKEAAPLRFDRDFYITILIVAFLLAAFYLKKAWLRHTGLFVSLVYFGFLKANFISMTNLGNILLWNLPDFRSNINWYVFIFSGLGLTFLLGRFYCVSMCPFGGLQEILCRIFRFKLVVSEPLAARLRKVRYILLWVLAVLLLALNNANIVNYEPFATIFLRRGSVVGWSIVFIVLALSLFHPRPFCNYFCAAGAFMDILSKWGRKILRKNER